MATDTLQRREVLRLQPLAGPPATANPETRTVEMLIATDRPVDGVILRIAPDAITHAPVVNVLLDHRNETAAIAGRLLSIRAERGLLLGLAEFNNAPAAEVGWQLASAGCPTSVRASYSPDDLEMGRPGDPPIVRRWRLVDVSLVGAGADPLTATRSAGSQPAQQQPDALEGQTVNNTDQLAKPEATEAAPSAAMVRQARAVQRRVDAILRAAPEAARGEISRIAEEQGVQAAFDAALDAAAAEQGKTPGIARSWVPSVDGAASPQLESRSGGFWASGDTAGPSALGEAIRRHFDGSATEPLAYTLRRMGYAGNSNAEVLRGALSTSDAAAHFEVAGNRLAMAAFAQAPQGVRVCASLRQLDDYREAQTLDIGLVGAASVIKQGGEITFRAADEAVAKYKPERVGLGTSITPETIANDDLSAVARINREMVNRCLEAEARALAGLLEGHAQGALAPDGARLFATAHNNTIATGPLGIGKIGEGVTLLRTQKSIGGALIYQTPATLLCAPAQETTLRQLLSDQINAAEAVNYNPWRDLTLEVDPLLSGQFVYLLASGERRPLELGRVTTAPVITSEVEFSTGFLRTKAEHSFGAVVVDFRPIVRMTVAGS